MARILYKIRDVRTKGKDERFSTGSAYPQFRKGGKTWTKIGHVKSHLTMIKQDLDHATRYLHLSQHKDHAKYLDDYLKNAEIVEYELRERRVI